MSDRETPHPLGDLAEMIASALTGHYQGRWPDHATLEAFVRRGGAVLAASDRAIRDEEVQRELIAVAGVTISQETVRCLDLSFCYRGLWYCPVVQGTGRRWTSTVSPPRR